MAIGTPVDRGKSGGTTSATTASFTPTAGSTLFAKVASKSTTTPALPAISDSLGGSWTKITDVNSATGGSVTITGAMYYQVVGGSPAAMTVSATGGTTATEVEVVEVSGCGTDFSNSIVATDAAGDPSCTLPSTPASTSAVIGFVCGHLTNTFTQAAGFSELYDAVPTGAANFRCEFAYDISSPAQTLSWTSTNTVSVGVALELKLPAAPTANTGNFFLVLA